METTADNRFGELRRTNSTLKNCFECYIEDLKEKGYSGSNSYLEILKFIANRFNSSSYDKKKIISNKSNEDLHLRLKHAIENAWMNELYLKESLNKPKNCFFFIDYVAFYYSIFNSLSSIVILQDPKVKTEHKVKIKRFNNELNQNNFLKEIYGKPFSIVITKEGCSIRNFSLPLDITGLSKLDEYINKYQNVKMHNNLGGDPLVKESLYTLKVTRSVLKLSIEGSKSNLPCSIIDYFLARRHHFQYKASLIFDDKGYSIDKEVEEIRKYAYSVLQIFNFLTEISLSKMSDLDLKNIFKEFEKKLIFKSSCKYIQFSDIAQRVKMI